MWTAPPDVQPGLPSPTDPQDAWNIPANAPS